MGVSLCVCVCDRATTKEKMHITQIVCVYWVRSFRHLNCKFVISRITAMTVNAYIKENAFSSKTVKDILDNLSQKISSHARYNVSNIHFKKDFIY